MSIPQQMAIPQQMPSWSGEMTTLLIWSYSWQNASLRLIPGHFQDGCSENTTVF